jgi:hypothetical protein
MLLHFSPAFSSLQQPQMGKRHVLVKQHSSPAHRAFLLLAIVLVGLALLLLLGKSRRGPDGSQTAQTRSASSGGVSFASDGKNEHLPTKRPRPQIDKRARSAAVTDCYMHVMKSLSEDLSSRAKSLGQKETGEATEYGFAIPGRDDLESYMDQLFTEEMERAKPDPATIHEINDLKKELIDTYKIPTGLQRYVRLSLPYDEETKLASVTYVDFNPEQMKQLQEEGKVTSGSMSPNDIHIFYLKRESHHWPYSFLFIMD